MSGRLVLTESWIRRKQRLQQPIQRWMISKEVHTPQNVWIKRGTSPFSIYCWCMMVAHIFQATMSKWQCFAESYLADNVLIHCFTLNFRCFSRQQCLLFHIFQTTTTQVFQIFPGSFNHAPCIVLTERYFYLQRMYPLFHVLHTTVEYQYLSRQSLLTYFIFF